MRAKIEKGGQGFRKSPPLFPVKIDGKEPYQVKAITSLFFYVRTPLFQSGAALPPANPAISEPVFPTPFNSMEDFSILAIPSPLSLLLFSYTKKLGFQTLARLNRLNDLFLR